MGISRQARQGYRYFDLVLATFVAVLLISNVASTKLLLFGPFTFDGGTLLFPISYIFGDILVEVYGYARTRRVIWTGFLFLFLMAGILALVGTLPPAPGWEYQEAYISILGVTPRIVLGSLLGFATGSFANSMVMAVMKVWTRGRWLWTRTIASTLVGQGVDTVVFVLVAFAGLFPSSVLWLVIISNYVFKCGFEALATPWTYIVTNRLKRAEGQDVFDYDTDLNPFKLSLAQAAAGVDSEQRS
jgi:queuosine precursor transporter